MAHIRFFESNRHDKEDSPEAEEQLRLGAADDASDEQAAAIASVTGQGTLTLDPNVQFQLRADSGSQGQVTYRVVQVSHDGSEATAQVVTSSAFPGNQVTVIQSPFSNGGSPTPEQQGDARFAYFPAAATADGAVVTTQAESITAATAIGPVTGQFYVMMSPQDVLQGTQRTIAPRTTFSPKLEGRSSRDDRRRATHNEVERRRRDKINNWIVQLSKLVPDCTQETVKQSQASKGGILAKACEYIQELRSSNMRLSDNVKEMERLSVDLELFRQQCEELKRENEILRQTLQQHGIVVPDLSPDSAS
ncbi:upstream stimulatory factor 2-like isoform X4 [Pomacea canaliculata]|uniref:upstream stimulatory factor 2-like isoform X4 n=1 Tax=Pomacea canaliculata TaxID=400727 RepID=UPI000D72CE2A|nr:upstream stimulatory factor 2-like isoform X4 [Pomacea canaliculata]